jgi:hypothetical protein
VLAAGLLLLILLLEDKLVYEPGKSVNIEHINYDSSERGSSPQSIKGFAEASKAVSKEISISFKMKVHSVREYDDLFQTAPANAGVRMELLKPSVLGLVVGCKGNSFKGFTVTDSLKMGEEYRVNVRITQTGKVVVALNGLVLVNESAHDLEFRLSDIAIGTGMSKSRPFDGSISDFGMNCRILIKNDRLEKILRSMEAVLLMSAAALLLILCFKQKGLLREQKIDIIALIVLAGFSLAVFFHYIMGAYLHAGYPFNTFLLRPEEAFMDYFNSLTYVTAGYGGGMVGTTGLSFLVWRFLYFISFRNAAVSFLVYSVAVVMYVLVYNMKNLVSAPFPRVPRVKLTQSLIILSFLSYPVLFTLDRGNIEGFAFMLLSLFVYFFRSNKTWISAVFLAGATALKIYPVIFFILYLSEKKYKEMVIFAGTLLLLYAWSYNSLQGVNFQLSGFISTIRGSGNPGNTYNALYAIGDMGAAFCSSAFGGLKAAMYAWAPQVSARHLFILFEIYYWVSLLLFVPVALYVVFVEKELWKKVAILTLSMIFFPFVTADYRLLNIYIPMWLFLNSKEESGADLLYSVLFALLLVPKAYYFIKGDISISVMINPLIIFLFLFTVIATGLHNVTALDIKQNVREHLTAVCQAFGFQKVPSGGGDASRESG